MLRRRTTETAASSAVPAAEEDNNNNKQDEDKFLDTDDQERLIRTMAVEMEKQQQLICSAFRLVCIGAIVTTLLGSLLLEIRRNKILRLVTLPPTVRFLPWIHVFLSMGLHGSASYIASSLPPTTEFKWILYIPSFCSLVVASNALFLMRMSAAAVQEEDETTNMMMMWLHQGMIVANLLTILGGLWLRWDALDIQESLQDLQASKYRYKSL